MITMSTTVFKKTTLALIGLACTAGIVFSVGLNHQDDTEVQAAGTANVSVTRIYFEDQINWTSYRNDPVIRLTSIVYTSGSGYTTASQVSEGWTQISGQEAFDITMTWTSGSNRPYVTILPWYISSATIKFHLGEDWLNNIERSVSVGYEYKDYLYGSREESWVAPASYPQISVNTYSVILKRGATTLRTDTVYNKTWYVNPSNAYFNYTLTIWHTDSGMTAFYSAGRVSSDTTLFGSPSASQVATWIMESARDGEGCSAKYLNAKEQVTSMSSSELTTFQGSSDSTIVAARERYANWALANNDSSRYVASAISDLNDTIENDGYALLFIGILGITVLGGYYVISRKKHLA